MKFKFTTFDIVLMALLAVSNGVFTFFLGWVNKALTAAGGPIATSTIVGLYMVYGLLAMYIIRKPGAAFITYSLGAAVQILTANGYGMAAAIVAALCYAVAIEAVFAVLRYRRWTYASISLASVCAVPLWFLGAAYLFGYYEWPTSVLIVSLAVRCLSGLVLCGLLTKWLGDRLAGTGLLKYYAINAAPTGRPTTP